MGAVHRLLDCGCVESRCPGVRNRSAMSAAEQPLTLQAIERTPGRHGRAAALRACFLDGDSAVLLEQGENDSVALCGEHQCSLLTTCDRYGYQEDIQQAVYHPQTTGSMCLGDVTVQR
jgi:hypothetical protein